MFNTHSVSYTITKFYDEECEFMNGKEEVTYEFDEIDNINDDFVDNVDNVSDEYDFFKEKGDNNYDNIRKNRTTFPKHYNNLYKRPIGNTISNGMLRPGSYKSVINRRIENRGYNQVIYQHHAIDENPTKNKFRKPRVSTMVTYENDYENTDPGSCVETNTNEQLIKSKTQK